MRLLLNEIIWEITAKCRNNCSYCGSKEAWDLPFAEDDVRAIANAIAEYPPNEINISGGDPLLVDVKIHEYIVNLLKAKNVKCKILVNPKSLKLDQAFDILNLYDHVGISINTQEELDLFNIKLRTSYTVITNFNIYNFFLAEKIGQQIPDNYTWQVQFTMYKNAQHPAGLWNHPVALQQLNDSLGKFTNLNIVVADNGNQGECAAGLNSLGILVNGDVVPCLSYRSWMEDMYVVGNLITEPLKSIWMNKFQEYRFEEKHICCKDMCSRQQIRPQAPLTTLSSQTTVRHPYYPPITTLYAVTAYGVFDSSGLLDAMWQGSRTLKD
jgi:MoaA/NifB/PqqE/SkfB family radical SAM enzyme